MENTLDPNKARNEEKIQKDDRSFSYYVVSCFFLTCGNVSFYKRAIQRKLIWTIAFFVLFGCLSSLILTAFIFRNTATIKQEYVQGYDTGELPAITIANGVASVEGPQPWISDDDGSPIIVDTKDQLTEIDLSEYEAYMLLRRNELQFFSDGQSPAIDLNTVNSEIADPIVIDRDFMLKFWGIVFVFAQMLVFGGQLFWSAGVRFAYIAGIALILWGIRQIKRKDVGYASILIIGLLANAPAIYIKSALSLFDISFPTLYTLLLLSFWILMLVKVFKERKDEPVMIEVGSTEMQVAIPEVAVSPPDEPKTMN